MSQITRRNFVKILGGTAAASALGFPGIAAAAGKKQVVIVGGGVGGATAAKYIRRADPSIEVTLIEPNKDYYTCFMSNEVLSGERSLDSLKFGYDGLRKHGVTVVHDIVTGIDAAGRKVTTQGGQSFSYDRAIVAPGISFRWGAIEGYDMAASQQMPHAWKAGPQTALLRKQLEAMADGGTVMIVPPPNPFRCPPGPYERACQIAHYLQQHKPKSKILIIDPKDSFSKQGLFTQAWDRHYKGMIEWRKGADTGGGIKSVDVKAGSVATDFDTYKPAVVNIIPAQKAGEIAEVAGLTDDSGWCPIEGKTFESTLQKGIHVVGDAAVQDPLPKSAYAANSEAKVVAAAVVDLLNDREPGTPSWVNTCYSLVAPDDGISVAMVYKLGPDGKVAKVEGSGGLTPMDSSPEDRKREVAYAYSWFENITHDTFD
jgi:sulfide dehydrogenase [flavocytochrome c] flavoprotein subunit